MKKIYVLKTIVIIAIAGFILQSCKADLRTPLLKTEGATEANVTKGKLLLDKAWEKQGLNNLQNHMTYSFNGVDHWKGMLGRMGKLWPDSKTKLAFKYEVETFNGSASFLDGKTLGTTVGLQSWNYYQKQKGEEVVFMETDKRHQFGLAAYQYFFEMVDRLRNAPIVTYAGEKEFNGTNYDLVFATWNKLEAHDENDQYLLWINKNTGMVEYTVFTLRDNYLKVPGWKMMYGSIKFSDYKLIDNISIPQKQTIFVFKPKKKDKKYLHELTISDFAFDNFKADELQPNKAIKNMGDQKPQ